MVARERGMNHTNLCRTLREKCGSDWGIQFDSDELNIHEFVPIEIPSLLAPELLAAVQHQLTAKRTYMHGAPQKYFYQLTGRVFCAHCGYGLFGQTNKNELRYYKHANATRARECPLNPRPWIRCERLEGAVVGKLFETFGNPAAIERAMREAIPDCDQLIKRRRLLETELEKIARGRDRLLDLVLKEAITSEQAEAKLDQVKPREAELRAELGKVLAALGSAVDTSQLERVAYTVFKEAGAIVIEDAEGNHYAGGNDVASWLAMTDDERLKLTEYAFASPCADGSPAGVYLT